MQLLDICSDMAAPLPARHAREEKSFFVTSSDPPSLSVGAVGFSLSNKQEGEEAQSSMQGPPAAAERRSRPLFIDKAETTKLFFAPPPLLRLPPPSREIEAWSVGFLSSPSVSIMLGCARKEEASCGKKGAGVGARPPKPRK